jgi:hypothetical protein
MKGKMLVDSPAGACGFTFKKSPAAAKAPEEIPWKEGLTVRIIRHPRARRYLLRLQPDGLARLVIPRRGSRTEGLRFLERNTAWLLERFRQWRARVDVRRAWVHGTEFLFRGEQVTLRVESESGGVVLRFGDQALLASYAADYRDVLVAHLRAIAEHELPPRTRELAQLHGIEIRRVSVRAVGVVLRTRHDFAQLAARAGAAHGPRLSHRPRADASPRDEPLRPLLEAGRRRLPRL